MEDSWRETFDNWIDWGSEMVWGPEPRVIIKRKEDEVRQGIRDIERTKKRALREEIKLVEELKTAGKRARKPADLNAAGMLLATRPCGRRGSRRPAVIIRVKY